MKNTGMIDLSFDLFYLLYCVIDGKTYLGHNKF